MIGREQIARLPEAQRRALEGLRGLEQGAAAQTAKELEAAVSAAPEVQRLRQSVKEAQAKLAENQGAQREIVDLVRGWVRDLETKLQTDVRRGQLQGK